MLITTPEMLETHILGNRNTTAIFEFMVLDEGVMLQASTVLPRIKDRPVRNARGIGWLHFLHK